MVECLCSSERSGTVRDGPGRVLCWQAGWRCGWIGHIPPSATGVDMTVTMMTVGLTLSYLATYWQ